MAIDIFYIVTQNDIDWNDPPPRYAGVGSTVREALTMACRNTSLVEDWIQEKDLEIRAYFTVRAYDMTTSPPSEIDRPDLKRGGGPVRDPKRNPTSGVGWPD